MYAKIEQVGQTLAGHCGLRGLFGIDGVVRDGEFWPVEVNPRYTASMELLEHVLGVSLLARHRQVFDSEAPRIEPVATGHGFHGKAILFARRSITFRSGGPWCPIPDVSTNIEQVSRFADIPAAGTVVPERRPIMTLFESGESVSECLDKLHQGARNLEHWLYSVDDQGRSDSGM